MSVSVPSCTLQDDTAETCRGTETYRLSACQIWRSICSAVNDLISLSELCGAQVSERLAFVSFQFCGVLTALNTWTCSRISSGRSDLGQYINCLNTGQADCSKNNLCIYQTTPVPL